MNRAEFDPMDPVLEQAMNEIRGDSADPEIIEAAAARVWARLAAAQDRPAEHIRGCGDFQALIPEYRAGRLPQARVTLLKDHLHECVACRKIYEGRVVAMPVAATAPKPRYTVRWAAAAVVVAAAGLSIWFAIDQYGTHTGRAIVQSVNGTLYELSASGLRPLAAGQELPDGVEVRTAKDSSAMLELRDGSVVEVRERSGLSTTQAASDLTVHLNRGSIIVQAAHRRKGHLYVSTADCEVAVTGTVFSVSAGVKGSRVSVVQGEVHVSQNNTDKVLRPGDQAVTSPTMDPLSVRDDIGWSRNREKLVQQLASLTGAIQQIHMPALRYESRLLNRLPATTFIFASIPNLSQYLAEAQTVFNERLTQSPELRELWNSKGAKAEPIVEKLRTASEYLGEEVVITGFSTADGQMLGPVFLAETRKPGFPEFLTKEIPPITIETRGNVVVFGPLPAAVKGLASALDAPAGGFAATPFYARIAEAYRQGAGLLLCGDLSKLNAGHTGAVRYFIAEQKEVRDQMETRASVGFEGQRTGIAAWLADPAPMGSLDYVSPEATFVTAFVVKNPVAIVDELLSTYQRSPAAAREALATAQQQTGIDVRNDLAASLGGEFSISLDGPPFPVPSWKLVTEVYDPQRVQATLQKVIDAYNQEAAKKGGKPLRTAQETVEGRTYYMIAAADPNPLTEAHYTFADGYLIGGPTRALVTRALQVKSTRTSITHSASFLAMVPRDHYANFSAVVYQNLGTSLAPLAGLLGAFIPNTNRPGRENPLNALSNMKPMMLAVYGEPDRLTVAGSSNVLGAGLTDFMGGNLSGIVGNALPFGQMMGTRAPQRAYR